MADSKQKESTGDVNLPPDDVNGTRTLGARVPVDLFDAFRLAAAKNRRTVSEHLRAVVERAIDEAA